MLIVRWNEDKEGCLLANWYDDERIEHGGFVETVVQMEDYIALRSERSEQDAWDEDEAWEPEALEQPRYALVNCR